MKEAVRNLFAWISEVATPMLHGAICHLWKAGNMEGPLNTLTVGLLLSGLCDKGAPLSDCKWPGKLRTWMT